MDAIQKIMEMQQQMNKGRTIIAIDGCAGSGKTTLANRLKDEYNANVFRMDDFFLPAKKKTKHRLSRIGGNIDAERFLNEVLIPLRNGDKTIEYKRFDCHMQRVEDPQYITPGKLCVVEGVYCLRSDLREFYDLKVLLKLDKRQQLERIKKRSGEALFIRYINEWLPLEEKYFQNEKLEELCDAVIVSEDDLPSCNS